MTNPQGHETLDAKTSLPDTHPLPSDIRNSVLQHLLDECDADLSIDSVRLEMSLRDDMQLDSMQAVSLCLDLEDQLEITLDDDDLARLGTVKDLLDVIHDRLAAKAGN